VAGVALTCFISGCSATGGSSEGGAEDWESDSAAISHVSNGRLWLTSPDDNEVVAVESSSLKVRERISIAGRPEQLLLLNGVTAVSLSRANDIAFISQETGSAVDRLRVPCGGTYGMAATQDGAKLFVLCPFDDRVIAVDTDKRKVVAAYRAKGSPKDLAVTERRLLVAAPSEGVLKWRRLSSLRSKNQFKPSKIEDVDWHHISPELEDARNVSQLNSVEVDSDTGAIFGLFQSVDNIGNRNLPPEKGGYGSIVNNNPRIEPRVLSPCGSRYARFNGGARVFSGPVSVAYASQTSRLWIANQYTNNVGVFRCRTSAKLLFAEQTEKIAAADGRLEHIATWRVGEGPRGITVSSDGKTAYVDVGFEHSVAKLRLPESDLDDEILRPELQRTRNVEPVALSERGLQGRQLFHDAQNTHLTPSGMVTCATCHPGGGEDGLKWFLHTSDIPRKLRRTPPAWQAREKLRPFHWDGRYSRLEPLIRDTTRQLLEGDAIGIDLGKIARYLEEVRRPGGRKPYPGEENLLKRGKRLFHSAEVGCAECHAGDRYTDGRKHNVLSRSEDPDGVLPEAVTPSLIGVRARAPYLHDGRAKTLEAVLTKHNPDDRHGQTSQLTEREIEALVRYLETL
jgi:DNA-binding beta-propeller fold protein YncE/mono/diheme cytochrome c family protein